MTRKLVQVLERRADVDSLGHLVQEQDAEAKLLKVEVMSLRERLRIAEKQYSGFISAQTPDIRQQLCYLESFCRNAAKLGTQGYRDAMLDFQRRMQHEGVGRFSNEVEQLRTEYLEVTRRTNDLLKNFQHSPRVATCSADSVAVAELLTALDSLIARMPVENVD